MAVSLGLDQSRTLELNDRWKNEFFPQGQCDNPSSEPDSSYEFGEMVGKINQILSEGKKACLFIGRTSSEALPPNDQKEEWISADIDRVNSGTESISGRIHLWIDCNQQDAIESLRGLFDRIVIDWSTIKFLNDDFAKRFSVMLRSPESSLIFESSSQCSGGEVSERTFCKQLYRVSYPLDDLRSETKRRQNYIDEYYKLTSADQQQEDWKEFMETPIGKLFAERGFGKERLEPNFISFMMKKAGMQRFVDQCSKWGIEQLKSHLETLFEHVELHSEEPFPYPANWNGIGYFLVSHPRTH